MKKTLVVYYSYSNGNTERIAQMISEKLGADMVQLQPVTPYSGTYEEVVDQGEAEVNRGYKPEIKPLSVNIADYSRFIIGTPTWWYTMAPVVLTFLTQNNWNGKEVIPFMTNGGWPGHVISDMKKACKGASFSNEKEIQFDSTGGAKMVTSPKEVEDWINSLESFVK